MTKLTVSAALSGAIFMGATAVSAGTIVQDFDLTATLGGQSSIQFDMNGDGMDDFRIDVFSLLTAVEPSEEQPIGTGEDFYVTEEARITALENYLTFGSIVTDFATLPPPPEEGDEPPFPSAVNAIQSIDPYVRLFHEGETVGGQQEKISFSSSALLYSEGFFMVNFATGPDGIEAISEGFGIGPFGQMGTRGFIGLALFAEEQNGPLFGWLEITRGSITVGTGALSTTPGAAVSAGVTAVPLPSGLALFAGAFGLMGFAARRRKAS